MAVKTTHQPITGIVWYRLESYDAARGIMEDKDQLPSTYSAWRISAEQGEKMLRRLGRTTTRAYIDPADFIAWCKDRGLKVDAEARHHFANWIALQAATHLE